MTEVKKRFIFAPMKKLSVITVNYNQPEVTVQFLTSVKKFTGNVNTEVILVDNARRVNHEEDFTAAFPNLIYLTSEKNIGFAGGNNLGIEVATGEYIILLNNDTEITEGFFTTMISEMEQNPHIGMLSPLILYFDDKSVVQYAGFTPMNYYTGRNKGIGNMSKNNGQYDNESYETGYCHGAAMMCRMADLKKAGLMDENYFLYYEELDWCEKFKRIGKKIWFTGRAKIYHKESMSVGKESEIKTYFMTRNRMLFIRKNTSFITTLIFSVYYIFLACTKQYLQYIRQGKKALATQTIKGLLWNFTHNKNSKKLGFPIN